MELSIGLSITAASQVGGSAPSWTWDATRIPTGYTIDGLTVGNTGLSNARFIPSTLPITERTYWEILNGINTFNGRIGLVDSARLGDFNSIFPSAQGVDIAAVSGGINGAGAVPAKLPSYVGATAMFVYDPATKGLWYGVNGTWIGAHPDTDPADIIASAITGDAHPAIYINRNTAGSIHTMRTASTNVYTPPAACAVFSD